MVELNLKTMLGAVEECYCCFDVLVDLSAKWDRCAAVRFFTDRFEQQGLPDEWCVAAVSLLDRVADASAPVTGRRTACASGVCPWPMAERLAAALIVLKFSGGRFERENGLRESIYRISNMKKDLFNDFWPRIVAAEFQLCEALQFRLVVPTVLGLADSLALRLQAQVCGQDAWEGLAELCLQRPLSEGASVLPAFAALARYLVELALANPDKLGGCRTAALLFASLNLALEIFAAPPAWLSAFGLLQAELLQGIPCHAGDMVVSLKEALAGLRLRPPACCPVARKWAARTCHIRAVWPSEMFPADPLVWFVSTAGNDEEARRKEDLGAAEARRKAEEARRREEEEAEAKRRAEEKTRIKEEEEVQAKHRADEEARRKEEEEAEAKRRAGEEVRGEEEEAKAKREAVEARRREVPDNIFAPVAAEEQPAKRRHLASMHAFAKPLAPGCHRLSLLGPGEGQLEAASRASSLVVNEGQPLADRPEDGGSNLKRRAEAELRPYRAAQYQRLLACYSNLLVEHVTSSGLGGLEQLPSDCILSDPDAVNARIAYESKRNWSGSHSKHSKKTRAGNVRSAA